jgi:hypothetical protein
MQTRSIIFRTLITSFILTIFLMSGLSNAFADHKVATWLGGTGNWSDPTLWNIGEVPNNGVDTYDVYISSGSVSLDIDAMILQLTLGGGSLSSSDKNIVTDSLTLTGGSLSGSGTVVVNGPIEWTGGGMSGTGVVTANGGIMISGSNYKYLYRPLNNANNQTAVYSGSNWNIGINVAIGVFNNLAGSTFEVHASTIGGYYTSAFNNEGTIVPVGIDKLTITPRFNNYGTLEIPNGELEVQGGGTSTNTLSVRHLNVNTGTLNIDPFVVDEGSTLNKCNRDYGAW